MAVIDDLVGEHLADAGIDMKPAYERLRKMVEARRRS
jgi:hypothetical protein